MRELVYIYAEYCPANLFTGWHLYCDPFDNDGLLVDSQDIRHMWLNRYEWLLDNLMAILGLPRLGSYKGTNHTKVAEQFMEAYPQGLVLELEKQREWHLPTGIPPTPTWKCFRHVRERQLKNWAHAEKAE